MENTENTVVDGPRGIEFVLGWTKVTDGRLWVPVPVRVDGPPEDGTPEDERLHWGVLDESRKHWYPAAGEDYD